MTNQIYVLDLDGYLLSVVDPSMLAHGAEFVNHTTVKPTGNRFIGGAWVTEPDNRGSWYNPLTNEALIIDVIGVSPPAGYEPGVAPFMPMPEARVEAWSRIKAARESVEFGPFVLGVHTFDGDSESQRRIQGAAQLATLAQATGQPFSIDWTLADNTQVTLTAAEMIGVGVALGHHVNEAHGIARTLRAQIDAATTPEQLEAIQWPV